MSSTRRVAEGERRTQHGWASSPEYYDMRGLGGNAVAFKAALISDPKIRNLLFFLRTLSQRVGIKKLAQNTVQMFPERIGTPTMIKIGCKPGKRLTKTERLAIYSELTLWDQSGTAVLLRDAEENDEIDQAYFQKTAEEFCEWCKDRAESAIESFIEGLCCDPKQLVDDDGYRERVSRALENAGSENAGRLYREPSLHVFDDVMGALFEFQKRHIEQASAEHVETSITKIVFEALDYVLETRSSALIEGDSGFGKSTGLKAWHEMHLGESLFIQLKAITHRTGFFETLAKASGLPYGGGLSSCKVQTRVEHFLQRTKPVLIIDEGQYLFGAGNRVTAPPELVNWLMTACSNEGIPFLISATAEFGKRRAIFEKCTTWQSEQLRRRIRRVFPIEDKPTEKDLLFVARKLLSGMPAAAAEYVAGYAQSCGGYFQAIQNAIDDAHLIARRAGRDAIKYSDLRSAIEDWRSPSDAAMKRVLQPKPEGKRQRGQVDPVPAPLEVLEAHSEARNDGCNRLAGALKPDSSREVSLLAG